MSSAAASRAGLEELQPRARQLTSPAYWGPTVVALSLQLLLLVCLLAALLAALAIIVKSVHRIGPNEVGLVIRRWGRANRSEGPIALNGEAGYQADLLMPGLAVQVVAGVHGSRSTRGCRSRRARSAS